MSYSLPYPYNSVYTAGSPAVTYTKHLTITTEYTADQNESYRSNKIVSGTSQGMNWQGRLFQEHITSVSVEEGGTPTGRYAFIIPSGSDERYCQLTGDVRGTGQDGYLQINYEYRWATWNTTDWGDFNEWRDQTTPGSVFPELTGNYDAGAGGYPKSSTEAVFSTNIPVFKYEDRAQANTYVYTNDDTVALTILQNYCINYRDTHEELPHDEWELIDPWEEATWTENGKGQITSSGYRNIRCKMANGGRVALYDIPGINDGALKWGIKISAYLYNIEKSTDGVNWELVNNFPFDFFYRPRDNEIGTFKYGTSFINTAIPHFPSEDDATDYIRGEKDPWDADNWDDISDHFPDGGGNHPGTPDPATIMGEVTIGTVFSQQYVLPIATLTEISTEFFDTTNGGAWENIRKGLDMYGDSPIESVMDLTFYPVNMNNVYGTSSQSYIYFGGYKMDLSGTLNKVINQNGFIDCGSVYFTRNRRNWMDFEPYTKCYVHLPYCGDYQLNLAELYDKTISIKYYVDSRAKGACIACIFANNYLIEHYQGQMGVGLPITLTDFSAYANAQIQTLLGFGGQATSSGLNLAGSAASSLGGGAAVTAAGLATAGIGAAGMGAAIGAKTVYGLSQNNINKFNKTRGGSTSLLNAYMPQYIYFTFERQEPDIPSNFYQLNGYPSNKSGVVGNFAGFLKCSAVKLNVKGATQLEREKIKAMLLSGIIIN